MTNKIIKPITFDNFRKYHFITFSKNKYDFIQNFDRIMTCEDCLNKIKTICIKILNGQGNKINLLQFNNLMFMMMNKYPDVVTSAIFEVFYDETRIFAECIEDNLNNNTFTIDIFITQYKKFYIKTERLIRMLWCYENKIIREPNNIKYSQINLMRSFLFYYNVIDRLYDYNNEKHYLYDILFSYVILDKNITIDTILPIFKMKQYYDRLSCIPMDNREGLFNIINEDNFMTKLSSNQEFVKKIILYLNDKIILMSKIRKSENKGNNFEREMIDLNNLVKFISDFKEKAMIFFYYQKFLENRLLNDETNLSLEKELIKNFKIPEDNKFIQEMMYKIEDIEESKKYKQHYVNLKVQVQSEKNKHVDINKLNRNIINMKILRFYAWEDSKYTTFNNDTNKYTDLEYYNIPEEMIPYIDIFNAYYKKCYPHRTLKWNFDLGIAIIRMKFGDREYQFRVTTPQLFLLLQFNKKEKISALELAQNMGIPLSKLGHILNSLLKAKLLIRDIGPSNDPNMKISIDENFYNPNDKLSLVNLMIKQTPTINDDKEAIERFAIGRENILQAKIVKVLKQKKMLTHNELIELVKTNIPFEITDTLFKTAIEACIKQLYITITNNNGQLQYKYNEIVSDEQNNIKVENSDDDSDDSDNDDDDDDE